MASDPSTAPTITLGPKPVALVECPALFSIAVYRDEKQRERGGIAEAIAYGAAALRMCWPPNAAWPTKPRPPEWRPGIHLGEYGMGIFEALRSATKGRVDSAALQVACIEAAVWAMSCGMTESEVKEAEDFSEGQEA